MNKNFFNIDLDRLIASLMVVAIHIYPLATINETLDYFFTRIIFRIAVPFFLMITGYYIIPKIMKDNKELKKYIIKTIKLYIFCIIIYIPFNIYNGYFKSINIISFIKDISINGTFYHLWYFPSLITGLLIIYYLIKRFDSKKVFIVTLILFLIGLMGDNYYYLIEKLVILKKIYGIIFSISEYTRNGIFYTPIFLYIGYTFTNHSNKISNTKNIILIILFLILMGVEGLILYYYNIPRHNSMYIFLIPTIYLIFNFVIYNCKKTNKKIRNISMWIYILHPLFIIIVRVISRVFKIKLLVSNSLINYVVVIIMTLIFSLFIIKNKFHKQKSYR